MSLPGTQYGSEPVVPLSSLQLVSLMPCEYILDLAEAGRLNCVLFVCHLEASCVSGFWGLLTVPCCLG